MVFLSSKREASILNTALSPNIITGLETVDKIVQLVCLRTKTRTVLTNTACISTTNKFRQNFQTDMMI